MEISAGQAAAAAQRRGPAGRVPLDLELYRRHPRSVSNVALRQRVRQFHCGRAHHIGIGRRAACTPDAGSPGDSGRVGARARPALPSAARLRNSTLRCVLLIRAALRCVNHPAIGSRALRRATRRPVCRHALERRCELAQGRVGATAFEWRWWRRPAVEGSAPTSWHIVGRDQVVRITILHGELAPGCAQPGRREERLTRRGAPFEERSDLPSSHSSWSC